MKISPEKLLAECETTGFRAEFLEKAVRLLGLLEALQSHPFLKGKLALKGGTALNLFIFGTPRLSVDIDLNYVGAEDLDEMLAERPLVEEAIAAVFAREDFSVRRMPAEHAGGKWALRYRNAFGRTSNLEVDLNFMFRVPLWPIVSADSNPIGEWKAKEVAMLNFYELAAGKLAALLARRQARDLFDANLILGMESLDQRLLRLGFVVYGAVNRKDWRTVSADDVNFKPAELASQLVPTLRAGAAEVKSGSAEYGTRLVQECREGLKKVLPFNDSERAFMDLLLDRGVIDSGILTDDISLKSRIQNHPLLEWKALNVRRYKK